MTNDDREAFVRRIRVLAETMGEPMTPGRVEGYFLALRDLSLEAVGKAIEAALTGSKFFPKPSELRDLAGSGKPDAWQIEALIVEHLRKPVYPPAMPTDPFLRLVFERLGGVWNASGMAARDRMRQLEGATPGIIAAAVARGIALPSHAPDLPQLGYDPYTPEIE